MTELSSSAVTQVSLKGSNTTPSLLYNNLTCLDDWCAYVHKNDVVVVNALKPDAPVVTHPLNTEGKAKPAMYQVKAVDIGGVPVLIAVTQHGAVLWDLAKERLLSTFALDDPKDIFLSRGVAVLAQGGSHLILIGHSNGSISVVGYENETCSLIKTLTKHTDNISDISSGVTEGGQHIFASADISGVLVVWNEFLEVIGTTTFPGDTITSIQIFSSFIAASFGSGLIRLYNAHDCSIAVEIAAHARWINAMCYDASTNVLASVSEDMLVCFWQMPCKANGGKVLLKSHVMMKDCLLTGVQLVGNQATVTAYDWDRLYVIQC